MEALHRTFITPIERDDIHRLITRMDDIMEFVEAAAERISLYEIREMTGQEYRNTYAGKPADVAEPAVAAKPASVLDPIETIDSRELVAV